MEDQEEKNMEPIDFDDYSDDGIQCIVCMEPTSEMIPFGDPHKPEASEFVPMCKTCVQNHVRQLWGGNT